MKRQGNRADEPPESLPPEYSLSNLAALSSCSQINVHAGVVGHNKTVTGTQHARRTRHSADEDSANLTAAGTYASAASQKPHPAPISNRPLPRGPLLAVPRVRQITEAQVEALSAQDCGLLKMGIYQSRAKNPINEFTIQPTVTRGGPSTFANRMHEIKGPEKDWTGLRRAKPVNTMLPKSVAWADSLPPAVRPNALIAEFPRIVNLLALQWNSTGPLRAYFDDLLTDHRGTRRGFPEAVYNEISALRDYHYSLSPNLALE